MNIKRGEVYWVELPQGQGSEQKGKRPCVIIQNNKGNKFSPTTIVGVLTKSTNNKRKIPTHKEILPENFKNKQQAIEKKFINSTFLAEQIKTVDLSRLGDKIGELREDKIKEIDKCIAISLGILDEQKRA